MKKTVLCFLTVIVLLTSCKDPSGRDPVIAIHLDKSSLSLNVGSTAALNVTILPLKASGREISWESSNEKIAVVNNGIITAISPGRVTITVSLASGESTSCAVTVETGFNAEVSHIELTKEPDKLMYLTGDELDLKGIEITVVYDDGDRVAVHITADHITGFDSSEAGEKTLTVNYGTFTVSFNVMVLEVLEIEITAEPVKQLYNPGELLDITGLEVTAYYFDGTGRISGIVAEIEKYLSGFDSSKPGTVTVTVSYGGITGLFRVIVSGIDNIVIEEYPLKTVYRVGEPLSRDGLVVRAEYTQGGFYIVPSSSINLVITGFDSFTAGEKTVTVSYGGVSAEFTVTVIGVTSINIDILPIKTVYKTGDMLDITGIKVTAFLSDDTEESVTITAANITGFNSNSAGIKTLSVNYSGASALFDITVTALSSITVTRIPNKTNYKIGESLDITGIEVTAIYSYEAISLEDFVIVTPANMFGFDSSSSGTKTVTVTFRGVSGTFTVNVLHVVSITVIPPFKTLYKIGEDLDITGIAAMAVYTDGQTGEVPVTLAHISDYDFMTAGHKALTVTIGEASDLFIVTVLEIDSLVITRLPFKTNYIIGEPLNLTGMEVTATYRFGGFSLTENVTITAANIIGFNSSSIGEKNLIVIFGGRTAGFTVNVVKVVAAIVVTRWPDKTLYAAGEILDLTGIEVTATYTDDTQGIVTVTNDNISGFNTSIVGEQILTVTYSGRTASFPVTIMKMESFNITFNQVKEQAPVITGPVIYLNTGSKIALLTAENPGQYSNIEWSIPGTSIRVNGAGFTLDSSNPNYNRTGIHFITLEVVKDGLIYSTAIEFEVRD